MAGETESSFAWWLGIFPRPGKIEAIQVEKLDRRINRNSRPLILVIMDLNSWATVFFCFDTQNSAGNVRDQLIRLQMLLTDSLPPRFSSVSISRPRLIKTIYTSAILMTFPDINERYRSLGLLHHRPSAFFNSPRESFHPSPCLSPLFLRILDSSCAGALTSQTQL